MEEADCISTLPQDIKISILSRLDIRDAIRTSAVACSWRHLWTLLPCLRLGCYLDRLGHTSTSTCGKFGRSPPVASSWIERVHRLVSSLRGPLLFFQLSHNFRSDQSALLQNVLDLLLQKGVAETLILSSYYDRVIIHLPFFHSLKVLLLSRCNVFLPPGFPGFKHLITLALQSVRISNANLHILIHSSNNLTTLLLDFAFSEYPLSVNISLPLLRHLKFEISESFEKVMVISAPCLEQAHIVIWKSADNCSEKFAPVTLKMVTSVATVSFLHLGCDVLEESFISGNF